jgi:hypothetical protein
MTDPRGRSRLDSQSLAVSPAIASGSIGQGWNAAFVAQEGGAVLRVHRGAADPMLEIRIVLTPEGPVVRARAAALEIQSATDLVARCERFRVEASDSVDIVAGGALRAEGRCVDVEATHGTARVRANDDVQLLGENVLLNCDRNPPMPGWVAPVPEPPGPSLPAANVSGDLEPPAQ